MRRLLILLILVLLTSTVGCMGYLSGGFFGDGKSHWYYPDYSVKEQPTLKTYTTVHDPMR